MKYIIKRKDGVTESPDVDHFIVKETPVGLRIESRHTGWYKIVPWHNIMEVTYETA